MIKFFAFIYDSFKYVILIFVIMGIWLYWVFSGDNKALAIFLFTPPVIGIILLIRFFRKNK